METTEPLVRMALHMMIKVHKFKLSKENKNKAEKHRIQVIFIFQAFVPVIIFDNMCKFKF